MFTFWPKLIAIGATVLLIVGSYTYAYNAGRWSAEAECDTATLQAKLDKTNADVTRLQKAAKTAVEERDFLKLRLGGYEGHLNELQTELDGRLPSAVPEPLPVPDAQLPTSPAPVAGGCAVRNSPSDGRATAADLRRLRGIGPD